MSRAIFQKSKFTVTKMAQIKYAKNCNRELCKGRQKTFKIVMVRHGQSEWNETNRFTGWYDAQLTQRGLDEAHRAGKALLDMNYKFDMAFSSVLTRAINTLDIILKESKQENIPIERTWRLNERHYGGLTGLNKAETAEKYGEELVTKWRRSYDFPPPAMTEDHEFYDAIVKDPRYANGPPLSEFPMAESLKLTIVRTLPYWNDTIVPQIKKGKSILVCAHGNSLRGIVKHLDDMTEEEIMALNLPTGIPFYYELDKNMKPVPNGSLQFLGDPETVKKAIEEVIAQGKKKA